MARRSMLLGCEQFEPLRRLRRSKLLRFLVPDSCHGYVRHEAMDAQFLQNHWIVGFGERHGGARISGVSRAPQHEASRGEIAARNQIIPSPERRGDFNGIEVVDRIPWDHGLCVSCRLPSVAVMSALIGRLDVLTP